MEELKEDIDSRLLFALNGVLEKCKMCPWKVLEFFVQERVQTLGLELRYFGNALRSTENPWIECNDIFSPFIHYYPEDGESSLVKPRARSTASGKRIPAGAVSIFGGTSVPCCLTRETQALLLSFNRRFDVCVFDLVSYWIYEPLINSLTCMIKLCIHAGGLISREKLEFFKW